MVRVLTSLALGLSLAAASFALGASAPVAQQPPAPKKAAAGPKAGKGEKVCRHKFPSGETKTWVCKQAEPCCAWDMFSYVKCGSTVTGCL
jgi:hypothetical protein